MISGTVQRISGRALAQQRRRILIAGGNHQTCSRTPSCTQQPSASQHAHRRRSLVHATPAMRSESSDQPIVESSTAEEEMPPIQWTTHRLSQESIEKTDRIFHKILWLNIIESATLTACVNQRLNLVMTKKQMQQLEKAVVAYEMEMTGETAGADGDGGEAGAAEEEAAPALVDLKLTSFDAKSKIKVIKEVRALTELGLKDAKELVESAPSVILKGLKPEAAEEIKAKLEGVGGQVELS